MNDVHLSLYIQTLKFQCFHMDLHYNQYVTDTKSNIMTEYHWEFLLPSKNGWHITIRFGDNVPALKPESNHLHLFETCYTGLQSISIYGCTCQSFNHNKSRSKFLFRTFIKMIISCTDRGAFSTYHSKAISLSQDTILMTHNGIIFLAKQSILVWIWMVLRIHT